jgi:hypothetical protein
MARPSMSYSLAHEPHLFERITEVAFKRLHVTEDGSEIWNSYDLSSLEVSIIRMPVPEYPEGTLRFIVGCGRHTPEWHAMKRAVGWKIGFEAGADYFERPVREGEL